MKFASRLKRVNESVTFRYSALAKGEGVINLTHGVTNFNTPKRIVDATKKAIDEGKTIYTQTRGIPELRKKIAEKLYRENGIEGLDIDNILVSTGAKQIIFEAVMALINKGDEVAIPDPSWVSYESIINIAQGKVVWLKTKPENGFIPDDNFLSELENSNPKLILINSPNNPTGVVYPKRIIKKIVDIAERKDSWILSDEIYEKIIYEGEHFSPGSIYDKTITVNGFSKEFSMTGWRLGYGASPIKKIIDKMNIIQSQSVSCAVSFVQYGALEAFSNDVKDDVKRMVNELKIRRDLLVDGLKNIGLINYKNYKPNGAFYVFPKLSDGNDIEIADNLLRNGIGIIPGSPFGSSGRGCVRMSYGSISKEKIGEVLKRLKKVS